MAAPDPHRPQPASTPARAAPQRWLARARSVRRTPRVLLWVALVALLGVAQTLLVVLTVRFEEARAQERSDDVAAAAVGEVRRRTQMVLQALQGLQARTADPLAWHRDADTLLRNQRELSRIERRDSVLKILESAEIGRASCRERV